MNYEPVAHQNQLLEPLVRMLPGITNLTLARSWQLLRVDTPSLVTSDDPVTLWSRATLAPF